MKQLPFIPQTPAEFCELMEKIWEGQFINNELTLSPWYDDWHDAIKVANHIGLIRSGGTRRSGIPGEIYRFKNGEGVFISCDGNMVNDRVRRFGERPSRHRGRNVL